MESMERDLRRAATYLVVREDLRGSQSRKTSRKVTCTPPNVKCGGRCIPPNWDCRLKGQGTNSELKVHSQDISAGIASTQRGIADIRKGAVNLNPAQLERGRRSVIRGAVKLTPGDNLEKKKQLRRTLEKHSNIIAATATLSVAALAGWKMGKGSLPTAWRNGVEDGARKAVNSVLDRAPFLASRREGIRAAAQSAAGSLGTSAVKGIKQSEIDKQASGNTQGIGPLAFRTRSMDTFESKLVGQMDKVNAKKGSFEDWKSEAAQTLFGATIGKKDNEYSVYSERAANEYLKAQFGLSGAKDAVLRGIGNKDDPKSKASRNQLVASELSKRINTMGEDFKKDMKVRGIISSDTYMRTVAMPAVERKIGTSLKGGDRKLALEGARATINAALGGEGKTHAAKIQQETVQSYNSYFANIAINTKRFAGNPMNSESPIGDVNTALARFEISRKTRLQPNILSREHGDVLLRQHWHQSVQKQKTPFTITDGSAQRVARTITRSTILPTPERAFKILNDNKINAVRAQVKATKSRTTVAKAQTFSDLARSIRERKGNEDMSMQASYEAAKAEMKKRKDHKEDEDVNPIRLAAYLQTREDLRGKPCGASHIPKAHDCIKGKGKEAPPERGTKTGGISGKKIAAAVLVGSVGAVAVAAASDAYQLNSGLGMPDTLTVRSAVKPHLNGGKGSDPVVMQAALGRYYDKQVKEQGWKVGDLIYAKTKNEPVSHFAIYMGKTKEGAHSFANMGRDGLNGKQGGIDVMESGTGAKRKTGLLYAKAPSNKQPKVKYSPEEIASRVSRLQGKKLDYDTFNANCESWANMIVSGKSRSTQSQRLTIVGKTAIRGVYKSLESISSLDEDYPKQVRSGERIQKVAKWLDINNPRGNDFGYQAMVKRNSKYRKDASDVEYLGLIDPSQVIKESMSDIEAISATKRWLMVFTAASADGPK